MIASMQNVILHARQKKLGRKVTKVMKAMEMEIDMLHKQCVLMIELSMPEKVGNIFS